MNESSTQDRTKEVTRLGYYHPGIDPIIDRLFPDPADNQSIRYILDAIVWKQRLKILENHRAEENGTEINHEEFYCWFNHEFYLRLLGPDKYSTRMKLLVENQVLKESFFTSEYARHPIYQLYNPDYLTGYTLKPITIPRVLKKIANYQKWRLRHLAPLDIKMAQHIVSHFWKINLDENKFRALWEKRYHERYLTSKIKPLPFDEYINCHHFDLSLLFSYYDLVTGRGYINLSFDFLDWFTEYRSSLIDSNIMMILLALL